MIQSIYLGLKGNLVYVNCILYFCELGSLQTWCPLFAGLLHTLPKMKEVGKLVWLTFWCSFLSELSYNNTKNTRASDLIILLKEELQLFRMTLKLIFMLLILFWHATCIIMAEILECPKQRLKPHFILY